MQNRWSWSFFIILALVAGCSETEQQTSSEEPLAVVSESAEIIDIDNRPNVLFIVADDLGFTDIGAFGSEISTPNLDALAYEGVRLTSLHAAPSCQPTRSMIMASAPSSKGIVERPPLEGGERNNLLSMEWATIPELLSDAGYATYMAGKWDLGWDQGYTPSTRGFDRSFAQLSGSSSFFAEPLLMGDTSGFEEDGQRLDFSDLPQDFYATNTYTEKMLEYLDSSPSGQPWFAFMPYTSPHWPLQLPEDWLETQAGNYDAGYDELRNSRVEKARQLGVIPESFGLEGFQRLSVPWNELTDIEKAHYSRAQEIYAGMIEHLDMSIGKVIRLLRDTDQLENTLIIFTSDHGASGGEYGAASDRYPSGGGGPQFPEGLDNRLENFGRPNSFIDHGRGYAEAASAPFAQSKGSMYEGGLRAAAFVRYPKEIEGGTISHSFMTMMDILPTIMDATETDIPAAGTFRGREILDPYGISAWPYLTGQTDTLHSGTSAGWSTNRGAALVTGSYKIIKEPLQSDWKLFNIVDDPGERNDIAARFPELVAEMAEEWETNWR